MIRSLLRKLLHPNTYSSKAFISYLRKKGITIGEGCIFYSPTTTTIDIQRTHMLEIGNYVRFTHGVVVLCHDYSRCVLCNLEEYGNVGEARITKIGDNCFIGINSIILSGCHIGDNCIVGAGSVVTGSFPSNSVICGNPAKVICSLEDFYKKRKKNEVLEAKEFVRQFRKKKQRDPTINEMTNTFSWLYLQRSEQVVKENEQLFKLNSVDLSVLVNTFMHTEPVYKSFEEFLEDCK